MRGGTPTKCGAPARSHAQRCADRVVLPLSTVSTPPRHLSPPRLRRVRYLFRAPLPRSRPQRLPRGPEAPVRRRRRRAAPSMTSGATANPEPIANHHVPEVDGRFNSTIDRFSADYTDLRGDVLFTDTGFYFGGSCVETYRGKKTTVTCQATYEEDRLELALGRCNQWIWNDASKSDKVRVIFDTEGREAFFNVRRPTSTTRLCNTNWVITLREGYLRLSAEP